MFDEIRINGTRLPRPTEALSITSTKVKSEYETEAGTTQVSVIRESKLSITGSWTLTGAWMEQFREWAAADTVMVSVFFPKKDELTEHECQLEITAEKHIEKAREQLKTDGLYQIQVVMTEL